MASRAHCLAHRPGGAGKTLAMALERRLLMPAGCPVLDGDIVRGGLCSISASRRMIR